MTEPASADQIDIAKAQVLASIDGRSEPSAALVSSWRRSHAALGQPSNVRDVPQVGDELLDSHLLEMFRAPLQRFAETLDGTGLGLLLSDSNGRILERWVGDRSAAEHFDKVGTFRGSVLSEDAVGTNGVGTALATGQLVQVRGAEHFADFYRTAICTGAPVLHPVTGKLLGSVTLSCSISPRAELLPPLLQTVTRQLQQHVLDVEMPASRRALEAFLHAVEQHTDAVVAIGPQGLVIQNALASKLSRDQIEEIHQACRETSGSEGARAHVTTDSLTLQVTTLEGDNHVAVVLDTTRRLPNPGRRVTATVAPVLVGRVPEWLSVLHQVARAREEAAPLIIAGEPGTGKLSVALGRPQTGRSVQDGDLVVADAAESHVSGTREWLGSVSAQLTGSARLVVRGAETLDRAAVAGLRSVLEHASDTQHVAITVSSTVVEEAEDLAVRLGGGRVVWVPPLRERAADLPDLWNAFARTLAPGAGMVLRPEALTLLRGHRWNGNLTELRLIVDRLAQSGHTGPVGLADLPEQLRESGRGLTLIEQVEVRAIRQALQEAGGNRARAAEILGVSRATVYRKMKTYRLID